MDYCVITTFDRKQEVENLVRQVQEVFTGKIIVFDDGSQVSPVLNGCDLVRYHQNHGKTKYYQLFTDIFQLLKRNKFERVWFLPDDVEIKPDLFTETLRLWNSIKDERKICISFGHTHNRHYDECWTRFKPVKISEEIVLTQWNDLCFMAERNFFELLNFEIERPLSGYDFRSSGVGRHISRTLFNHGWNLYHTDKSYCDFLVVETKMHV